MDLVNGRHYLDLKVVELKQELRARGLPTGGLKCVLQARLRRDMQEQEVRLYTIVFVVFMPSYRYCTCDIVSMMRVPTCSLTCTTKLQSISRPIQWKYCTQYNFIYSKVVLVILQIIIVSESTVCYILQDEAVPVPGNVSELEGEGQTKERAELVVSIYTRGVVYSRLRCITTLSPSLRPPAVPWSTPSPRAT